MKHPRQKQINKTVEESTYSDAVRLAHNVTRGALRKANLGRRLRSTGSGSGRLSDSNGSKGARDEEGGETHLDV